MLVVVPWRGGGSLRALWRRSGLPTRRRLVEPSFEVEVAVDVADRRPRRALEEERRDRDDIVRAIVTQRTYELKSDQL